jgi:dipeptidyl aminopeptidase/acylaminoacyl peptidase
MKRMIFLILTLCAPLLAQSKVMTPELLWKLGRVGAPVPSPNGQWIAYTVTHYNLKQNNSNTDLWVIDPNGKEVQLTSSPAAETSPQWTPDGNHLIYLRHDSHGSTIMKRDMRSIGAAEVVHTEKDGLSNFKLSPDGTLVAFTRMIKLKHVRQDRYSDLPKANVRIYDSLLYRHWDKWFEGEYSHIHVMPLNGGKATNIMEGMHTDSPKPPFGGTEAFVFTPDSQSVIYTAMPPGRNPMSTDTGLYKVSVNGGERKNLTADNEGYDTEPVFSPDGKKLVYLSMETPGYESDRNRIIVMDVRTGEKTEVSKGWDETVYHASWWDNDTLIFNMPQKGSVQLFSVSAKGGKWRQITEGRHNLGSFKVVSAEKPYLVATRSTHERANEIVAIDMKSGRIEDLTNVNDKHYEGLALPTVIERWLDTKDGKKMHTWVILPPNFDENKKYPMLTYCQGGPQGMVSQFFSFRWNFHLMAAQGYVVVAPNRRGLPGFGREWNDEIIGDYGGKPIDDLLVATDAVMAEPYVDKNRVGAVGASYGGYSVFMLMGRSYGENKRFATMIAHCGMFSTESFFGATEELFFANNDLGGPYWESEELKESYKRNSPSTYVKNWETPILIIHNEKDYRVPINQGFEAFTAAKLMGVEARFVNFPEENHWVLTPQNGILWQREFFGWLAKYCRPNL